MGKKQLQEVTEDEVIWKLGTVAAFAGGQEWHWAGDGMSQGCAEMAVKEVWGVREAKTHLSTLLTQASEGQIHFVTAGDGSPIVVMSARRLADAVATIEEQRGMTFADALEQLPYPPSELAPVNLSRRAPTRGLMRRVRQPEEA